MKSVTLDVRSPEAAGEAVSPHGAVKVDFLLKAA
jgi:hypothetical protein